MIHFLAELRQLAGSHTSKDGETEDGEQGDTCDVEEGAGILLAPCCLEDCQDECEEECRQKEVAGESAGNMVSSISEPWSGNRDGRLTYAISTLPWLLTRLRRRRL